MISTTEMRSIAEMFPDYRATRTAEAVALITTFAADVTAFDMPTDLAGIINTVQDLLDVLGEVLDTIEIDGYYRSSREDRLLENEREESAESGFDRGYDQAREDAVDAITDTLFDRGQDARYDSLMGMTPPLADADYLRNLSETIAAAVTA